MLAGALLLGIGASSPTVSTERIVYELRQHYCPTCLGYILTVDSDGSVALVTRRQSDRYSWKKRARRLRVSPAQVEAFRAALRPYRPQGKRFVSGRECDLYITHSASIMIEWRGGGDDASFDYDLGCSGEKVDAMRAAIERAPTLLGIAGLPDK